MRSFPSALAILTLSASIASAADYSERYDHDPFEPPLRGSIGSQPPAPSAPSAPPLRLGGLYAGVNAGYGGGTDIYRASAIQTPGPDGLLAVGSRGFIGGGQIGYSYIAGYGMLGFETDFAGSTINDNANENIGDVTTVQSGSHIDYIGTIRGRAGVALGPAIVYATGGFAYADMTSNLYAVGLGTSSASRMHDGYTIGGGIEYAIAPNISLRTEYQHIVLNGQQFAIVPVGPSYQITQRPTVDVLRAGLDFHFAGLGPSQPVSTPIIARY